MKQFRVAVGALGSKRSTVWKFSHHRADAYITCRMFNRDGKVSFHASGQCHWALTDQWVKRTNSRNQERFFAQWFKERPSGSEAPQIFRIAIPSSELDDVETEEPFDSRVTWLADPGEGLAVVLNCHMTPPIAAAELELPPNTLCSLPLADGRHFVVIPSVERCPFDMDVLRIQCLDALRVEGIIAQPGNRLCGFLDGEVPGLLEMTALPTWLARRAV